MREMTLGAFIRSTEEIATVVSCPTIVKYRHDPSAPVRIDAGNEKLHRVVDLDTAQQLAAVRVARMRGGADITSVIAEARVVSLSAMTPRKRRILRSWNDETRAILQGGGYSIAG